MLTLHLAMSLLIIIVTIFFNNKLTIAANYKKIKDMHKNNKVGLSA